MIIVKEHFLCFHNINYILLRQEIIYLSYMKHVFKIASTL
jgi:hypothetical protein